MTSYCSSSDIPKISICFSTHNSSFRLLWTKQHLPQVPSPKTRSFSSSSRVRQLSIQKLTDDQQSICLLLISLVSCHHYINSWAPASPSNRRPPSPPPTRPATMCPPSLPNRWPNCGSGSRRSCRRVTASRLCFPRNTRGMPNNYLGGDMQIIIIHSTKSHMFLEFLGSMSSICSFHLGPIVDFKYPATRYLVLSPAGFFSTSECIRDLKFASSCSSLKQIFPNGAWMFLPASTLQFTCPALACWIAFPNSLLEVSVPTLALGMSPRGPSTLPNILSLERCSGVVNRISKSVLPSRMSTNMSLLMNMSAPALLSSSFRKSSHSTATLTVLPSPAGMNADPLTIWSPFLGLTPSWMQTSTVSVKLVKVWARINWSACQGLYSMSLSWGWRMVGRFFWRSRSLLGIALRSSRENLATGFIISLMINIICGPFKNSSISSLQDRFQTAQHHSEQDPAHHLRQNHLAVLGTLQVEQRLQQGVGHRDHSNRHSRSDDSQSGHRFQEYFRFQVSEALLQAQHSPEAKQHRQHVSLPEADPLILPHFILRHPLVDQPLPQPTAHHAVDQEQGTHALQVDKSADVLHAEHEGDVQIERAFIVQASETITADIGGGLWRYHEVAVVDSDREGFLEQVAKYSCGEEDEGEPIGGRLELDSELYDLQELDGLGVVEHHHLLLECFGVDGEGVGIGLGELVLVVLFDELGADAEPQPAGDGGTKQTLAANKHG